MVTRLAIDVSNYSGPISLAQAQGLYDAGVRKAIVQFVNPNVLTHAQQIPALKAAGIEVEGYVFVWFSAGETFTTDRTNWACNLARSYDISMMWLDCEQSNQNTPPFDYVHLPVSPTIRAAVAAVRAVPGMTPGIYTAAWWWIPGASNSQEWADLPLWNANYDLDPDIDPVDYGGWTVPRMEQYQADQVLAGVPYIDLDSYEGEPDAPPPLPIAQVQAILTEARSHTLAADELILQAYNLLNG